MDYHPERSILGRAMDIWNFIQPYFFIYDKKKKSISNITFELNDFEAIERLWFTFLFGLKVLLKNFYQMIFIRK